MKVRIRIRSWIRIKDLFEGSYNLFYKVSLYFGATFQIVFEKYTLLNRLNSYESSLRIWIRIQDSYEGSYPESYLDSYPGLV